MKMKLTTQIKLYKILDRILMLFRKRLIIAIPISLFNGTKLTAEEVKNEIESYRSNYKMVVGVHFYPNPGFKGGIVLNETKKLEIYPDSLRVSHSTIKSLRGTLDKLLK